MPKGGRGPLPHEVGGLKKAPDAWSAPGVLDSLPRSAVAGDLADLEPEADEQDGDHQE